ncbi:hypothetical protein CWM61_15845 [Klebsiella sp. K-Nf6]|nr:hypothetical protein CWM61_15845 [Klebsiella sp. K-Nf6]
MAAYGTGSDLQRGIQAATAALQGLAGGDIAGALAGASAPELANLIGHGSGLSDGAAVVAHAILGGAVAALQGNSAAAGAAGEAAGELAARAIAGMLYPGVKDLSTLTEAEKQTVSTLATISAGMAGGLAGDSTASAVAGAQGGKNAVENNSLSKDKIYNINPLPVGALDENGDRLKGGGGIGNRPANMSPEGAGRNGAFREAKRQAGIPVTQSPSNVYPNRDKRDNLQPGLIYEFTVPNAGGGTKKVYIRDDAAGHSFGVNDAQNRGPHFNDPKGNHYDY